MTFPILKNSFSKFRESDDGGIYIFGVYVLAGMVTIGSIAIDVSHLVAERTKLQMTADLAAHAALYNRDSENSSDAITAALAVVENSMPQDRYGTVITADDILFGTYDYETEGFTLDSDSRSAVIVTTKRAEDSGNSVASFLMQFAGISDFDITTQAVFTTFRPACLREGFVAEGVVDLQSNNGFSNGFCIHSNTHASLNSNNYFEEGTVVSMPDLDDLDLPNSGFESNLGLEVALRQGRQHIRVLNMIDEIAYGLLDYGSEHMPSYITDANIVTHNSRKYDPEDFVVGTINYFDCSSSVTLNAGVYSEVVLYSECEVKFGAGVVLEDVVVFSESTHSDAFKASSGLQVGRDDGCASGGGAQLLTYGGMRFPASLQLYGAQLIALKTIEFAANADGIEGASMISGEGIDGTSNMEMAFCGSGMENNFEAEYFRLAH